MVTGIGGLHARLSASKLITKESCAGRIPAEGPIIELDVVHVSHASTPEELIAIGRDIERRVLARAVKLYAEDRIFIVGNRTVIFN